MPDELRLDYRTSGPVFSKREELVVWAKDDGTIHTTDQDGTDTEIGAGGGGGVTQTATTTLTQPDLEAMFVGKEIVAGTPGKMLVPLWAILYSEITGIWTDIGSGATWAIAYDDSGSNLLAQPLAPLYGQTAVETVLSSSGSPHTVLIPPNLGITTGFITVDGTNLVFPDSASVGNGLWIIGNSDGSGSGGAPGDTVTVTVCYTVIPA